VGRSSTLIGLGVVVGRRWHQSSSLFETALAALHYTAHQLLHVNSTDIETNNQVNTSISTIEQEQTPLLQRIPEVSTLYVIYHHADVRSGAWLRTVPIRPLGAAAVIATLTYDRDPMGRSCRYGITVACHGALCHAFPSDKCLTRL
jgi:hypothetical protein